MAGEERGEVRAGPLTPTSLQDVLRRVGEVRAVASLHVSDGVSERCVFFPVGGLRLTSVGGRRGRSVTETLLANPKVPVTARAELELQRKRQQQAVDSLVARVAKGAELGGDPATAEEMGSGEEPLVRGTELEAIVERHDLREAYHAACRVVARDELVDLIVWDGAEYELRPSNPPPKIFAAELEAVKLSLGVKDLLAEVSALVPEWTKLSQKLGAPSRTLVRPGPAASTRTALRGLEGAALSAVPAPGCTLAEVIVAMRRGGHDALASCRAVVALADQGALAIDRAPPVPAPAERKRRALGDIDRIEAALALMVEELTARKRLAAAYQETGDVPKAVENLRKVGEGLAQRGRHDEAIEAFRFVLDLAPEAFDARERIAGLLEQLGRAPEAVKEWLALARQFAGFNLLNRALQTLRNAVRLNPKDVDNRRRVAAVLEAKGEPEAAARELEGLVRQLDAEGDEEGALWCLAEIARLQPEHPEAKARLARAVRRGAAWFVPIAAVLLLALTSTGGGLWLWRRHELLLAWRATRAQVLEQARRGQYAPARSTLVAAAAEKDFDEEPVARLLATIDSLEDDECRVAYGRSEAEEKAGRVEEARDGYRLLLRDHPERPFTKKAGERLDALDALEREAATTARQVEELTREGKTAEALEAGRDLAARLGWTEAARALGVPIELRTTPPGAAVSIDGEALPQRTPCVIARPATKPWELVLTLDNHLPWTRTLDVARGAGVATPLEVALERAPRWKADVLGPMPSAAAALPDGGVVLAGEDARVVGLASDGAARWATSLPPFSAAVGHPVVVGGRAIVVDSTGRAHGLEGRSGALRWSRRVGEATDTLPELTELAAVGRGHEDLVVLSHATGLLALDPATGEERWRLDLGARLAAPATLASPERALVPLDDAHVALVEVATGKLQSRLATSGRPTSSAAQGPSLCVVGVEGGTVEAVWRGVVWSRKVPGPVTAPPVVTETGVVYVAAGEVLLALDVKDGAVRWEKALGAPLGAPASGGGRVYVGAADGAVRALLAASGAVLWTARADGEVLAAPLLHKGLVVVASKGLSVLGLPD